MTQEDYKFELEAIENEIIETLQKYPIFSVRDEISNKILFYFIFRRDLTQSDLQQLTGCSAGKISQELNNFLEFDLIRISKRSKPWIYSMDSIMVETFSRAINLLKTNIEWESKFLEIKKELDENREELEEFNGYNHVKDFIDLNLKRFVGYKHIIELWEKLKKKYEKEAY